MKPDTPEQIARGRSVRCQRCDGKGSVFSWSYGVDECPNCYGSGLNWLYPNGALARCYSGPFLGRILGETDHAR